MENRFLCGGFGGARGFGGPGGVLEGHVEVLLLLMEAPQPFAVHLWPRQEHGSAIDINTFISGVKNDKFGSTSLFHDIISSVKVSFWVALMWRYCAVHGL